MIGNESWIYQGRQSHGWFGHGTAPHDDTIATAAGQPTMALAQQIRALGHTLIAGLPRSKRHHDAARLSDEDHARLDRVLAATVQALPLGRAAIARSVFDTDADARGIADLIRTAQLVRDAGSDADLRAGR